MNVYKTNSLMVKKCHENTIKNGASCWTSLARCWKHSDSNRSPLSSGQYLETKMRYKTRTAPRLPCLVFDWAKRDVWYIIHLEKYILFLIGWRYSRYGNKEWLKLEGASGVQEMLSSTVYLLPFWVWPGIACSSMQGSWHFCLLLYFMAWNPP